MKRIYPPKPKGFQTTYAEKHKLTVKTTIPVKNIKISLTLLGLKRKPNKKK